MQSNGERDADAHASSFGDKRWLAAALPLGWLANYVRTITFLIYGVKRCCRVFCK
jgi:hypothetical protein